MNVRTALISVSDKTGLIEFARALVQRGFDLLTTSGSGAYLAQHGIASIGVDQYTGQAEIFGGRVKTLHPMIYAGILARREVPGDLALLARDGIRPIEVVAVNLYPFRDALVRVGRGHEMGEDEMIELIDIGGPSMIRAAAKNHASVLPLIDPADYALGLSILDGKTNTDEERLTRRGLAAKVFATLADDGVSVASYLSGERPLNESGQRQLSLPQAAFSYAALEPSQATSALTGATPPAAAFTGVVLRRDAVLRYGENPHQQAEYLRPICARGDQAPWRVFGGKALSYNNLLDVDAIVRMLRMSRAPGGAEDVGSDVEVISAIIVKHLNPCGAAQGRTALEALQRAKRSDPRSHFGGIIGFTGLVTRDAAESIREDFAEVIVAPAYDQEALTLLLQNKNLRVLQVDLAASTPRKEFRSVLDGVLCQTLDESVSEVAAWRQVCGDVAHQSLKSDLYFAWQLCSHVKSNAIVLAKEGMLIGVGAGQMSRIDSVELALSKAGLHGHDIKGAVAASDAFFPFPDAVNALAAAGVRAIVAPGGAKRDEEVIEAARVHGLALFFSPDRHFRH